MRRRPSAQTDCTSRLEAQHGAVTEWWVNSEAGLQQGWTVHEPTGGERIVLGLAIEGARTHVSEEGLDATFMRPTGSPLHYSGLEAWDADGELLATRMVEAVDGLSIEIDTADAAFPVTIDPWLGSWQFGSGQVSANLGMSVSSAGDVNGDGYDEIIVAAPCYDNGSTDEGRVWMFMGSASGLATEADWTWETNQTSAQLGYENCGIAGAMDLNGDGYDDIALGAHYYDKGQTDEGVVFVFYGSADGIAATPDWTGESNQSGARYGYCVAAAGDVNGDGYGDLAIGSPWYDNGHSNEGRVWVYHGSSMGVTVLSWTAEADQSTARFGYSIDGAGDVDGDGYDDLIIGAPWYDNGHSDEGRAFVFHGSATGLEDTPAWTYENNNSSARPGLVSRGPWGHQRRWPLGRHGGLSILVEPTGQGLSVSRLCRRCQRV